MEEVVLEVLNELAVAGPVTSKEESDSGGASERLHLYSSFFFLGHGQGRGGQLLFMHNHLLESRVSRDRHFTVNDNVDNVLTLLHVCLCGSKTALRAVVVPLDRFVDRVSNILLALEVKRDPRQDGEQCKIIAAVDVASNESWDSAF